MIRKRISIWRPKAVSLIIFWLVGILSYAQEELPSEGVYKAIFHNNLIYLSVPINDTDSLLFHTDTGGKNYIYKSGLKKLGISKFRKENWHSALNEHFEENVAPTHGLDDMIYFRERGVMEDGMLGREWFGKDVWHFDYDKERIFALGPDLIYPRNYASMLLFFRKDELGKPINHLARMFVYIDGENLSLLFDTGAQVNLSESAQQQLDRDPLIATSFINASIFDRWRREHPEWKVYEDADVTFKEPEDIIIVPSMYVGHQKIGPVAFTRRADSNFNTMSTYFMDEPIVGALGGNALSQLGSFIVDYQSEQIILR